MTQPVVASAHSGHDATAWAEWLGRRRRNVQPVAATKAAGGDGGAQPQGGTPPPPRPEAPRRGLLRLLLIAAAAVAVLPIIMVGQRPSILPAFVLGHSIVLEGGALIVLLRIIRRDRQPTLRLLTVAQAALFAADTTYNVRSMFQQYPNPWHHLGEFMHTVWLGVLAAMFWRRMVVTNLRSLSRAQILVAACLMAGALAIALYYVIAPLEARGLRLISRVVYWSYYLVLAVLIPAVIYMTVTTLHPPEHMFCQGLLLALVCGAAMSYQVAASDFSTAGWGAAGWATGAGCMSLCMLWTGIRGTSLMPVDQPVSPYRSYRCILPLLASFANVSLLAVLLSIRALDTKNTSVFVATICGMFISWFLANCLALSVSRQLLSFVFVTPDLRHITETQLTHVPLLQPLNAPVAIAEIERLHSGYNRLVNTTNWLIGVVVRKHRQAALAALAAQVAHDLGSPTAALNVALDEASQLPEGCRQTLRAAVHRIQDITMQLLVSFKGAAASQPGESPQPSQACLASSLVAAAVAEKRLQYRDHPDVRIESVVSPAAYGVFVQANANEVIRIISNLVNNSISALGSHGSVCLEVVNRPKNAQILVVDNGCGLPEQVVARLGDEQLSRYLDAPEGLGVQHAHRSLRALGGRLRFSSHVGLGTTAVIELPKVDPPSWFLRSLDLREIDFIVVLDDDLSAHRMWRERLRASRAAGRVVIHASTSEEFAERVRERRGERTLFLVDYELSGDTANGLDLIEQLELQAMAVLVSGMLVLEADLTRRARALGVRILMKSLVRLVPIAQAAPERAPEAPSQG